MAGMPRAKPTLDDYFAAEVDAFEKSEWVNGAMYLMSGATPRHNDANTRLLGILGPAAWSRSCTFALADQRVNVEDTGAYVYPDLVLTCGKPVYSAPRPYSLHNPTLIAEVASDSTQAHDEGWKWDHYRRIPSLQVYLRVLIPTRSVVLHVRQADGAWRITDHIGDDPVSIADLDVTFPASALFAGLDALPEPDIA